MIASPDTSLTDFLVQANALLPVAAEQHDALREQFADAADHLIDVDLGDACDKHALLGTLARAFDMPRWFGHNWDALEECLTDLDWLPDGSVLVLITGTTAKTGDAHMLTTILEAACDAWQADGRAFHVVIDPRLLASP